MGVPSGLRPATGGEGQRENVQTESKTVRLVAEMALSAVRKNPQEPAQTRGSRQKKANPEGLVFPLLVDAYIRLQQQQEALEQLRQDLRDAMQLLRIKTVSVRLDGV